MARAPDELGGATRLVALKAVATGYPLRGQLLLADRASQAGRAAAAARARHGLGRGRPAFRRARPAAGTGPAAGDASLRIAGLLLQEPDRGAGFPELRATRADEPG